MKPCDGIMPIVERLIAISGSAMIIGPGDIETKKEIPRLLYQLTNRLKESGVIQNHEPCPKCGAYCYLSVVWKHLSEEEPISMSVQYTSVEAAIVANRIADRIDGELVSLSRPTPDLPAEWARRLREIAKWARKIGQERSGGVKID